MIQPSFDDQLAKIRGLLEKMSQDAAEDQDPLLLHGYMEDLCEAAKKLPPADRTHAVTLMETLLAEIDTLIIVTQNEQTQLVKKLEHVRPHRQAVAAFLKASKTDQ
jgi:hypothetical protein